MAPYLYVVEQKNKQWWIVDYNNFTIPLAICNTFRTAVLVARCMAATGNCHFHY